METMKNLKTKKNNILGRFDMVFYVFILFTLPKLISRDGINFNFMDCFYTNGLFDKTGVNFVSAFLFELPIAFVRWIGRTGMLPLLVVALVVAVIDIRKNKFCKN